MLLSTTGLSSGNGRNIFLFDELVHLLSRHVGVRRAGLGYDFAMRIGDLQADLLAQPGLFRDQIEPFFKLIQGVLCTSMDMEDGVLWL
ncbi:MAG: hypothetical protein COA37_16790 [Hoeflea sp.]|nr:MAG: hypothetical protein COA37_16790 [Hoeflea sp.]